MTNKKTATSNDQNQLVRLSKLMAERGLCSRREADQLIENGHVYVDGFRQNTLGVKVSPNVKIEISEEAKRQQKQLITVLLNKPIGYVSAHAEDGYTPAIKLLDPKNQWPESKGVNPLKCENLAVAGRLDIDSQGLLVFTQDGRIARQLINSESEIEKEYIVRVVGQKNPDQIPRLRHGLEIDGRVLKRAEAEWINDDQLRIILKEGLKRQVRKMCEAVGLKVIGLKRVRVGQIRLGELPEGKWRFLYSEEEF